MPPKSVTCRWVQDNYDEDTGRTDWGPFCDQPATHSSCVDKVVCEKHKCRCSRLLAGNVAPERTHRTLIVVSDGDTWFVRRVRTTVHDLDRDEMVYRCDSPLGGPFASAQEALESLVKK